MKRARLLPILIFIAIQAVLLCDVAFHDPMVGYDSGDHLRYVATLAHFELPDRTQTIEFFSPPLPYAIPALAKATLGISQWWAGKIGQLMNLVYSIGLCWCMLKICDELRPGSARMQFWSLALIAIVPVYYKSFSMVRGEPLLAFMVTASVYWTLRAYRTTGRRWRDFIILGVLLGMTILSRQWAFLIFPALLAYALVLPACGPMERLLNLKPLMISLAIAALVGGWFYLSLNLRFGKLTTFSRTPKPWSFSDQPPRFYYGLGLDSLFSDPIRPAYVDEFIPTFYSEFWGDYQCYFLVYGKNRMGRFVSGIELKQSLDREPLPHSFTTNRFRIAASMGRAQAAAIVPSLVFLAGLGMGGLAIFGIGSDDRRLGLPAMIVVTSMLGYFVFTIRFANLVTGDTIKATYMLQIVPMLAVLGASFIIEVQDRFPKAFRVLTVLLMLSAILNAPFLFTRYVTIPWEPVSTNGDRPFLGRPQ